VLVDQEALEGGELWKSHEPAALELFSKTTVIYEPDCTVAMVVAELFWTTIVPLD